MKRVAYAVTLMLVSLQMSVLAQQGYFPSKDMTKDESGLFANPECNLGRDTKSALKSLSKQVPTGEKATTERWEMEIFAAGIGGGWTVLGKSIKKEYPSYILCYLARGTGDYRAEPWFKKHF